MTASDRAQLIDLYCAAVAGADPESLTTAAMAGVPLEPRRRVWLFSFGKAAHAMADAAVSVLHRELGDVAGGVIVAPEAARSPAGTVSVMAGDHPVPRAGSLAAAERIAQVVALKRGADLGIVLLSGGASSLIAAPLRGLDPGPLSDLSEALLRSGLDIQGTNAIRKRFSYWAAGRMALGLAPARTYCFALSDVVGDDLATIGSGPCVPDPTPAQRVIDLLRGAGLFDGLAAGYRQYLLDSARGVLPETPKPTHPAFAHVSARVIGNNALALEAAAAAARSLGFITTAAPEPLVGDAAGAGERIVQALLALRERAAAGSAHCCIWGGETTVSMRGTEPPGGRCQELALSAANLLAQAGERARGIAILSAGTDGRDGNTDAAGAVVDGDTWRAIAAQGCDPREALQAHGAHAALASVNALFAPGRTRTNVMDVTIGLVRA